MNNDQGSSLAAVLIVVMVVTAIGLTSAQLARHSNDATSVDRERVQALNAAEAGVHQAIKDLHSELCGITRSALLDQGEYDFSTIHIDSQTCLIESLGKGRTGTDRTRRMLHVEVALKPLAFTYTLFSATQVVAKNTATILGDVYAADLHQSHNDLIAEDIISPGDITTKNNATYDGMIWSGGDVLLRNNSKVVQAVIAGGNIVLENGAQILGDALAGGSITAQPAQIQGSATANSSEVPSPPTLGLPHFTSTLPTFGSAQALTDHLQQNAASLTGAFRVEGGPDARVTLPDNATVTGPLTIVTNGKIELGRSLTGADGPHQVVLVARCCSPAPGISDAIDIAKDFTGHGLDILLFSYGGVDAKNRLDMTGAIYAHGVVDVKNKLILHRSFSLQDDPPTGFIFASWETDRHRVVPTMWREVPPPPQ